MPNWCQNHLVVAGPPVLLNAFKQVARQPSLAFERKRLIERALRGENEVEDPPALSLFNFDPPPAHRFCEEFWREQRWDVKWDVNRVELMDDVEEKAFGLSFETPWGPPIGGVERMAGAFPGLFFRLRFIEGGMGSFGNIVWLGNDRVAEQDLQGDGFRRFAQREFGVESQTDLFREEGPEIPVDIEKGVTSGDGLRKDPAFISEGLEDIASASGPEQARSHIQALLEAIEDWGGPKKLRGWSDKWPWSQEVGLLSAAVVSPVVDRQTVSEVIETGRPGVLRFVQAFTEEAEEFVRRWALEQLTTAPPPSADEANKQGLLPSRVVLELGPPRTIEKINPTLLHNKICRHDSGEVSAWKDRQLDADRLLERQTRQGETLSAKQWKQLQAYWEEACSREGPVAIGQRFLVGNRLLDWKGLDEQVVEAFLEEAPEGSLYWQRALEHPNCPLRRALEEIKDGPSHKVHVPLMALAGRIRDQQAFDLLDEFLEQAQGVGMVQELVGERGNDWYDQVMEVLTDRYTDQAILLLCREILDHQAEVETGALGK